MVSAGAGHWHFQAQGQSFHRGRRAFLPPGSKALWIKEGIRPGLEVTEVCPYVPDSETRLAARGGNYCIPKDSFLFFPNVFESTTQELTIWCR